MFDMHTLYLKPPIHCLLRLFLINKGSLKRFCGSDIKFKKKVSFSKNYGVRTNKSCVF